MVSFEQLRLANIARLPEFRNKHGFLAHSASDGSDWTVAQWVQATFGELGEFAMERHRFEQGQLTRAQYEPRAASELADVATYLDITARRALDETMPSSDMDTPDAAQMLMWLIANLGMYANERKKFDRGDISLDEFKPLRHEYLSIAMLTIGSLMRDEVGPARPTIRAHATGVKLGEAVRDKFNEVSLRVGSDVTL